MKHLKKIILFVVGIGVLLMAIFVFFRTNQKTTNLEAGNLSNWRAASVEQRIAAAKILIASEENIYIIVACVDKMSTLADSGDMAIRDAVALCNTGIQLKSNL